MKVAVHTLVLTVIVLNLFLGFRGVGDDTKDFFTMKPFSDPVVHCETEVFVREEDGRSSLPFLEQRYLRFSKSSFTRRVYLEVIPLYAQGLRVVVRRSHPNGEVRVTCTSLYDVPPRVFHF